MATTNNRSWKALLPRNGGIGVCPQIGRVKIPPVCPRSTLNLTGGRRIKTVRACWFEGDEARSSPSCRRPVGSARNWTR